MVKLSLAFIAGWVALVLYAYVLYPGILWTIVKLRRSGVAPGQDSVSPLPRISVVLPVYNEEHTIRETLDQILSTTYPPERLEILVVSDASSDATDSIVQEYSEVRFLRLSERAGKTAAENRAATAVSGDIVVCTDASVRISPSSFGLLARAFEDPAVGVASGNDVSVEVGRTVSNPGEQSYVGYEMYIRSLETRLGSIVGASGCLYAIRSELYRDPVPEHLSRDFLAALVAREAGMRAISVQDAVVQVPRTRHLRTEFWRKVRTMARGLETLWYKRALLNPFGNGSFAFKLWSHKVCRWLIPALLPLVFVSLLILAAESSVARIAVAGSIAAGGAGVWAVFRSDSDKMPAALSVLGYATGSLLAGVLAWATALSGERQAAWEPTRRLVARN